MIEITKGYKQTELGVIPEDWEIEPIKQLATITTGSKNTQDRIFEGLYPFFVRSQTIERINSYSYDGEAVLTAGDGVGTGKVFHYINGKFDIHQRVYKISDFNKKLNGYFFFLYFSNNFFNRIMQMTAKSSVDSVRMEMIADMQIPVPTKAEQTAISTVLSDTDALIERLEKLIAKKKAIKQGAMQQLLTGKKRLPGFSGEWEVKKLGDVGSFSKGQGIRKDQSQSGELPCIRYGELYTRHSNYIKKYYSFISKDIAVTAKKLVVGDILFAGSGETKEEIGKCAAFINSIEAYAGGDVVIFSPHGADSLFLGYLLNSPMAVRQKASRGQGDAVVHISASNLKEVQISVPPTAKEQTAIATILTDMDAEIESLEQKRDKYTMLKLGMMQELLTGRIRLNH